jgi:hypothetical protein
MVTPMIMPMVMSMANTHDYYQTLQTVTLQKSDINEAHLIYISIIWTALYFVCPLFVMSVLMYLLFMRKQGLRRHVSGRWSCSRWWKEEMKTPEWKKQDINEILNWINRLKWSLLSGDEYRMYVEQFVCFFAFLARQGLRKQSAAGSLEGIRSKSI